MPIMAKRPLFNSCNSAFLNLQGEGEGWLGMAWRDHLVAGCPVAHPPPTFLGLKGWSQEVDWNDFRETFPWFQEAYLHQYMIQYIHRKYTQTVRNTTLYAYMSATWITIAEWLGMTPVPSCHLSNEETKPEMACHLRGFFYWTTEQ